MSTQILFDEFPLTSTVDNHISVNVSKTHIQIILLPLRKLRCPGTVRGRAGSSFLLVHDLLTIRSAYFYCHSSFLGKTYEISVSSFFISLLFQIMVLALIFSHLLGFLHCL